MLKLPSVLIAVVGLTACQTPFLVFSGGALAGPVANTDSFSFAAQYRLLKLEVRPEKPYAVILRVVMRDGQLYIDAADRRRWHIYLRQNPDVRVKLGSTVYLATAVRVRDPEVAKQFLAGRTIYRLVPRKMMQSRPVPSKERIGHKKVAEVRTSHIELCGSASDSCWPNLALRYDILSGCLREHFM